MSFIIEKQAAYVLPPVLGSVVAVNCSTNATVLDITSIPASPATPGYTLANQIAQNSVAVAASDQQNPVGHYLRITAQGGDVYFVQGSNFALLNAINSTTVYSTVNATTGKVTVNGQETDYVPAGSFKDVLVVPSQTATQQNPPGSGSSCRYIALVASAGNAIARLYQSSP